MEYEELPPNFQSRYESSFRDNLPIDDRIDILHKIIEAYPNFWTARLDLADSFFEISNLVAAEAEYQKLCQEWKNQPAAVAGLATVLSAQERHDEAGKLARKALDAGYEWASCYAILSLWEEEKGDFSAASSAALQAYLLCPQEWWHLERSCELVGRTYVKPSETRTPPIGPILRGSLCSWTDTHCKECDGTFTHTSDWAKRHEVDPIDLYQYLGTIDTFCDCQVVLQAENMDLSLQEIRIEGRVQGGAPTSEEIEYIDSNADPTAIRAQTVSTRSVGAFATKLLHDGQTREAFLVGVFPDIDHLPSILYFSHGSLLETDTPHELPDPLREEALTRISALSKQIHPEEPSQGTHPLQVDPKGIWIRLEVGKSRRPVLFQTRGHKSHPCETEGSSWQLHPQEPRLAYLAPRRQGTAVILLNPKTGHWKELLRRINLIEFCWEATGRSLWVVEGTSSGPCLVRVNLAGEEQPLGPGFRPAPSPDGRVLLHARTEDGGIQRVNLKTGATQSLGPGIAWGFDPDGSNWIRTVHGEKGNQVQLMSEDQIICSLGLGENPAFLPQGRSVIMAQNGRICRFDLDDRSFHTLTQGPADRRPTIHPRRSIVAFERVVNRRRTEVWTVSPDGSGLRKIGGKGLARNPIWWL
ncbi:MAG: hypothetical protein QF752_16675 [Planctomycetota bacterium]|nr:hypothetical protein [Planctomycetota bacterium]